jgi:hypothetical protein
MFVKCSECNKTLSLGDIKYYTADQDHAFCDAYCSNAWYSKTFEKLDAKKDQTDGND